MQPCLTDQVRDRTDLAELFRAYGVRLTPTGRGFSACCPFHPDKRPSMVVWPEIDRWKCFGCEASGDCFEFLTRLHGISFREALETLAARAGLDDRTGERRRRRPTTRRTLMLGQGSPDPDFSAQAKRRAATTTDVELLEHAEALGVTLGSLRRLGGFVSPRWPSALGFPMRRPSGRVVGVRIRNYDGRKWSVRGSRNALFLPTAVDADPLFVSEGPTDAAALLDLGVSALGRPSCAAGISDVVQLVRGRSVVIVADRDRAGQEGALKAAHAALTCAARIRVWTPGAKDARSWVNGGATLSDLTAAVAEVDDVRLELEVSING